MSGGGPPISIEAVGSASTCVPSGNHSSPEMDGVYHHSDDIDSSRVMSQEGLPTAGAKTRRGGAGPPQWQRTTYSPSNVQTGRSSIPPVPDLSTSESRTSAPVRR